MLVGRKIKDGHLAKVEKIKAREEKNKVVGHSITLRITAYDKTQNNGIFPPAPSFQFNATRRREVVSAFISQIPELKKKTLSSLFSHSRLL